MGNANWRIVGYGGTEQEMQEGESLYVSAVECSSRCSRYVDLHNSDSERHIYSFFIGAVGSPANALAIF